MARSFNLMLTGNTLQGFARDEVAAALAQLMRLPEERALDLLSGRETVVKRGLDGTSLQRYLEALSKAGVETRKEEIFPAPDSTPPGAIKCPACGTEQPNLTICRQCGTDMPGLIAARAVAARNPPPRPPVAAPKEAVHEPDPEIPRYRRSRALEVMLFLFVSVLWGFLAMTDGTRGRGARILGAVTFAFFGAMMVLALTNVLRTDAEHDAVIDAFNYAVGVSEVVGKYAIANQRLPERTVSIDLAGGRPGSVKSVDIGPGGRVRVMLSDDLKKSSGGAIVFMPGIDNGVIVWACASEGVPAGYLGKSCD